MAKISNEWIPMSVVEQVGDPHFSENFETITIGIGGMEEVNAYADRKSVEGLMSDNIKYLGTYLHYLKTGKLANNYDVEDFERVSSMSQQQVQESLNMWQRDYIFIRDYDRN